MQRQSSAELGLIKNMIKKKKQKKKLKNVRMTICPKILYQGDIAIIIFKCHIIIPRQSTKFIEAPSIAILHMQLLSFTLQVLSASLEAIF